MRREMHSTPRPFLMSADQALIIHAFGCSIQTETACAETHAILDRYIFPSLPRYAGIMDRPDIYIRVDRVADRFHLQANGADVASADQASTLVPALIRVLDDAVVEHLTTLRVLHAGVVQWNGRALLLPGMSHAGKSSLVAELLRRGATYFSDEYALIDAEGRVHPYPRPLLVRNGSPEQHPMLAGECNAPVGDAPAQIGWIMSLQYMPSGNFSVAPVTQGEAVLTLLRNTPHILSESPGLVEVFQRAVSEAACYTGCRGEAAQAVDEILRLIDD